MLKTCLCILLLMTQLVSCKDDVSQTETNGSGEVEAAFKIDPVVERKVPYADSILLRDFWINYTSAIRNQNKEQLADLIQFPFYCRPCLDYDEMESYGNEFNVKVTRDLFLKSTLKQFFKEANVSSIMEIKAFEGYVFFPVIAENGKQGYMFDYVIVAPSSITEGIQGFIYISKFDGRFKIDGIDTVP